MGLKPPTSYIQLLFIFFLVKVLPINPESLRGFRGLDSQNSQYQYLQMVSNCGNKRKGMLQDSANVAASETNYISIQSPLAAANTKT